jgi:hypothetical protein
MDGLVVGLDVAGSQDGPIVGVEAPKAVVLVLGIVGFEKIPGLGFVGRTLGVTDVRHKVNGLQFLPARHNVLVQIAVVLSGKVPVPTEVMHHAGGTAVVTPGDIDGCHDGSRALLELLVLIFLGRQNTREIGTTDLGVKDQRLEKL